MKVDLKNESKSGFCICTVLRKLISIFLVLSILNLNFRIIAVGYEARAKGVTRQMRGNDAKAKCPEIILVRVPEVRGKADLTR